MYTVEQLRQQIQEMGIQPWDTVLVHSSLHAVGPVEGGADGLIDAFCGYLTEGLFLVPTHTWANVDRENPVYDVRSTVPCIGTLPRVAAFRTDGVRSLHPTHSMWGCGKDAESFLRGEELAQSPGPVGFAWSRLAERNAKILLVGVGNNRNTFIHAVDEIVDLPNRLSPEPFDVTIIDAEGNRVTHPFYGHFCTETCDVSAQFGNFDRAFTEVGVWQEGRLGNATVKIVDSVKCRDLLLRIYSRAQEDLCVHIMDLDPSLWR